MRSYTVVGAGAVGLLYGTRLAAAGHPVRWLVRGHADALRRDGIAVRSEGRLLRIAPDDVVAATDGADLPASDVVLLATKTTANDRLGELVGGVCAPGATVVVLQNGLGAEERVRAEVPAAGAVLGGLCFVCAHREAPGRADHLDYGAVTLAPLDDAHLEVAEAIGADLSAAGVEVAVLGDLGVARWRKLVWNIPFNGLCTVLGATTDELLAESAMRELVRALMEEVADGAAATGNELPGDVCEEMLSLTDAMRPYDPSMKLDHDARRPLEVDAIYGVATRAARAAGAPMRRVEALAAMLRFLDRGTQ